MKIFLFLLVIDLSRTDSSTKHAGNFLFTKFQFHFLCTGHPLASAGAYSDHSNSRGVECQAGKDNTFVFRFELFLDYLDIAFAIWYCFVKLDQYGNKWCIFCLNLYITFPFLILHYFRVNFHTGGLLGEYEVEGCNGTSPTLVLEREKTYTMVQVLTKKTHKKSKLFLFKSMQRF